jgi:UDP-2-acetamido-3-amino-2,3-dideoxy-glucuronate N-acetyltransferase
MPRIHADAEVSAQAQIGEGTSIWKDVQVRERARIGQNCNLGKGVFVDVDVVIGDNVKIQNNASLHEGVELEDGVFVGPMVVFTNDKLPRSINPDGSVKSAHDWICGKTLIRRGAAIGASSVIVTGITIGRWAMVGSGSTVTKDVPDHALVFGNPARVHGYVSATGVRCATQQEARALTEKETGKAS